MLGYDEFRATRRFRQLDGYRAISVLLVIATHIGDPLWKPLRGYAGVIMFFVASGFIITTLLLREEQDRGRVSIRGFYVRRAFRLFPMFYAAVAVYSLTNLVLGSSAQIDSLVRRLPLLLLYMNEFAGEGTLGHTWSLAVEEKFYFVWPILAFGAVTLLRRSRAALVAVLLAICVLAGQFPGALGYLGIYVPVLAGCGVAIILHSRRGYAMLSYTARPAAMLVMLAAVVTAGYFDTGVTYAHITFSLVFALAFPGLILNARTARALSAGALIYIGRRSYGVFLFHVLFIRVVDMILPLTQSVLVELARYGFVAVLSIAFADVAHRLYEKPLIKVGHRLSAKLSDGAANATVQPVAAAT